MKFSFRDSPGWFTEYVTDNFLDEFHEQVKNIICDQADLSPLIEAAVEFFTKKGLKAYCYNQQLWFDLDETKEYTLLALKWS